MSSIQPVTSVEEGTSSIKLHSRTYSIPKKPTVIICIDGFDPEYLQHGIAKGIIPTIESLYKNGFHSTADVAMPTLTNPNNVSIITGVPSLRHGISGNYFLDRETGKETMIKDDSLLHGSTILAEMSKIGVRVAAITAKDKLRRILNRDFEDGICFSAEYPPPEWETIVGRPAPPQYSGDLSIFVLDVGVRLLQEKEADLVYLTLSDYIQHKHAPDEPEAENFFMAIDARIKSLIELGAIVAATGDHGMSYKCNSEGDPNVLFLQDELETRFGAGSARVICPITDPFVRHHGGLGSFVRIYLKDRSSGHVNKVLELCSSFSEVQTALDAASATKEFEMPLDREGDVVVVARKNAVIGSKKSEHDLETLKGHKLRSHGGLSEQKVPLLLSKPVREEAAAGRAWRNFDIFDLALNW